MEEEPEKNYKSLYIFGRDVSKIPCFRNSFFYGIGSGIGIGLATFLFTSRVRYSTNMGVAGYAVVTLGYWCKCRYQYSQKKFEYGMMKAGMQAYIMFEGTDKEKDVDAYSDFIMNDKTT